MRGHHFQETPVQGGDPGLLLIEPLNGATVVLGPSINPVVNTKQCVINANFTVQKLPTKDSTAGGAFLTTNSLAAALFQQGSLIGPAGGGAVTPVVGPDLQITKLPAAPGPTITAGTDATFTIVVHNNGSGTAKQVSLSDTLPFAGLTWSVSAQSPGLNCTVPGSPQTLSCNLFNLDAGGTVIVALSAPTSVGTCPAQIINT